MNDMSNPALYAKALLELHIKLSQFLKTVESTATIDSMSAPARGALREYTDAVLRLHHIKLSQFLETVESAAMIDSMSAPARGALREYTDVVLRLQKALGILEPMVTADE